MASTFYILAILIATFVIYRTFSADKSHFSWRELFDCSFLGLLLVSVVSVILLELNVFHTSKLCLSLLCLAAASLVLKRQNPVKIFQIRTGFFSSLFPLALVAVLLIGAYFRFPPSEYFAGEQDQGIYVNVGNHIAKEGSVFIQDPMPELLKDNDSLYSYYRKHTYRGIGRRPSMPWAEEFIAGVYFKDKESGVLVPQFYHLHPLWVAIGVQILGEKYSTIPIACFSLALIALCYFLSYELFRKRALALSTALFVALNPPLSYFAKFPVSESMSAFFFLGALYYLIRAKEKDYFFLSLSALSLFCVFFTRITGFLFIPLILAYTTHRLILSKSSIRPLLIFTVLVFAFYSWSFIHGLIYSYPYSRHIYQVNLSADDNILKNGLLITWSVCAAFVFLTAILSKFKLGLRKIVFAKRNLRTPLIALVFIAAAVALSYKGYILAYTDELKSHPWIGTRWHIAGRELVSLHRFNFFVLAKFLSPVGMICFIFGLASLLRRSFYTPRFYLITLCTCFFFFLLCIHRFTTPYMYYYGRYLSSELVPLAIIIASYGIFQISKKYDNKVLRNSIAALLVLSIAYPSAANSYAHSTKREMDGFYKAMKEVEAALPENAVVLVDTKAMPLALITTPMRLVFQIKTINIYRTEDMKLKNIIETMTYLENKGYKPYLLSRQTGWKKFDFLPLKLKTVAPKLRLPHSHGRLPGWNMSKKHMRVYLGLHEFDSTKVN